MRSWGGWGGASGVFAQTGAMVARATDKPYIVNLHEDPLLTECVMYAMKEGVTRVGVSRAPRADA